MLQGSQLRNPSSDLAEFQTYQRYYSCPPYLKNEEVSIKIEGARVVTTLYLDFLDAQGQLTL